MPKPSLVTGNTNWTSADSDTEPPTIHYFVQGATGRLSCVVEHQRKFYPAPNTLDGWDGLLAHPLFGAILEKYHRVIIHCFEEIEARAMTKH